MKYYALCFALFLLTGFSFLEANGTPLVYNFEFEKKKYVAKKSIDYPLIKMIARRGYGDVVASVPVTISYIGKENNILAEVSSKLNLRSCINAGIGQKCAQFVPEMLINFFKTSCSLRIVVDAKFVKDLPWGQCQSAGDPNMMADLKAELVVDQGDEDLKLYLTNLGKGSTNSFRVLLIYLDANGREISYSYKNISNRLLINQKIDIPIDASYLYTYTCKLKVIIDPDYLSSAVPKVEHLMTVRYGNCSEDIFEPYVDLSVSSSRIISNYNDSLLEVLIYNNGDQVVSGRALEVKVEGFDSQKNPVFKERITTINILGPKESDLGSVKISNHILEKVCMISFEVNATHSLLEFNKNNNKTVLNRCN